MQRSARTSDKIPQQMYVVAVDKIALPLTPFWVLGLIFVVSLGVFLWITHRRDTDDPDQ